MQVLGVDDAVLDDGEAAELWAASGAQWLTDPEVPVPAGLVRRMVGLVESLDRRGAALADLVPARGLGLFGERAGCMGLPPSDRTSAGGASRLIAAADGWFVVSLARDDDVRLVPAWLEVPFDGTAEDVWPLVETVVARRDVDELVHRGALLGLPCAVVGEVQDPRPVVARTVGQAEPRSVDGAVVVTTAALWAGPLCADALARLGARVITVESTTRPDGGRRSPKFFRALHGRSESVALDLSSDVGRAVLRRLLLAADVVIEGSRPRAFEQMGIWADEIVASGPRLWVSITAQGRDGPARDRTGFGDDAAAAGGLVGWVDGVPRFLADAVADPLAGATAASAVANLLEQGGRWIADVALARVASSIRPQWVFHLVPGQRPRPRRDPGAPMPLGRDTGAVLCSLGIE